MASFGEKLRQARESRKITLQEIAETTKIGTRSLQALESNRFDQLPGGIFNKGFVRSYARFVGLDEDKTVAEYMAAANVAAPEVDMQAMSAQVTDIKVEQKSSSLNGTTVVGVVAILVAVGMVAVWLNERRKDANEAAAQSRVESSQPAQSPVAPPPTTVTAPSTTTPENAVTPSQPVTTTENPNGTQSATPSMSPSATSSAAPTLPPSASAPVAKTESVKDSGGAPVEISIAATAKAWISVRSDGKTVESVTLDPDKPESRSRTYSAKEKLLLVVGNPAGLSVTYNGKPTGTLGTEGHRATITFTPEGMETR